MWNVIDFQQRTQRNIVTEGPENILSQSTLCVFPFSFLFKVGEAQMIGQRWCHIHNQSGARATFESKCWRQLWGNQVW